jgi:FKBP-type peptidyl-prolyl cis-trans isomerase (trigger factor)
MNLTTQERPDGVMVLKATVAEADYAPEVEKSLREMRRKANVPGFRPGMVPMGMINKMYRRGVVAEQAYRKANDAVFKYLEENKVSIMGDVMPSDEQGKLDFEGGATEHEFVFEVAPAPVVDITAGPDDKLTRYKIKPSKEMREGYRGSFLRRFAVPVGEGEEPREPALDAEFFAQAFPDGKVTDAAGLDKYLDEALDAELAREGEYLLGIQLKNHLLAKANVKLPEEFLKNWLFAMNEGKFTMEQIEAEFPAFLRMMSWDLVAKHFTTTLGIEVKQEDMLEEAKAIARMQFAQYGMTGMPEETIEGFAKNILANKEEAQRVYDRTREDKILTALKALIKIGEKSVTQDEFRKVATESTAA